MPPRYNIAPASEIPVVRLSPEGERVLHLLRWGLLPHWAKDAGIGTRLINARGESVNQKPAFRDAFRRRRCLIPASGFYEWQAARGDRPAARKQACYISLQSGETMAFGGLWEAWTSPAGEIIRSCCIITTGANALMQPVHERMPLILAPEHWRDWLTTTAAQANALIQPYRDGELQVWPVSARVGKVSADDAALIEPLSEALR